MVEGFWNILLHHTIPENLPADTALMECYCLSFLCRQDQIGDPLLELGATVAAYLQEFSYKPYELDPCLKGFGQDDGEMSEGF